jgi:hypothetical protein
VYACRSTSTLRTNLEGRTGGPGRDEQRSQAGEIADTIAGALHLAQAHHRKCQPTAVTPCALALDASREGKSAALEVRIGRIRKPLLSTRHRRHQLGIRFLVPRVGRDERRADRQTGTGTLS